MKTEAFHRNQKALQLKRKAFQLKRKVKKEGTQFRPIIDRHVTDTGATLMSAQQQPTDSLSEAAALLNNILASAETIRTLSNATTIEQQRNVGMPCVDTDSQLASPFPSRQRSSLPLPGAAPVMRECAPRYQAQQCFGGWTSGTRRKR